MAAQLIRQRYDNSEIGNSPSSRSIRAEVYHARTQRQDDDIHAPKVAEDTVQTDLEAGLLELLGGGGPLDLDAEEMARKCFAQVVRQPTEEKQEQWHPLDAIAKGGEVAALTHTVAQHGERDR